MEINLKIIKIITDKIYFGKKDGKPHNSVNYYLAINDKWVAIRPSLAGGYSQLDVIANVIDKRNKPANE